MTGAFSPDTERRNRSRWWLAGLAGLLGLAFILTFAAIISGPASPAPTTTPTANPTSSEAIAAASTQTAIVLTQIALMTTTPIPETETVAAQTALAVTDLAASATSEALATQPGPDATPIPTAVLTPITPVAFIPPAADGLWPMPAGDPAQTGFVIQSLTAFNPIPRWSRNPLSTGGTGLVVGGGRVVFGADGGIVRALDWADGRPAWDMSLGGSAIIGALAIYADGGLVFAATDGGELYGLNLSDGSVVWIKSTDELQGKIYGGVTVASEVVYAATDTGRLHTLNAVTGEVIWSLDLTQTDVFYFAPGMTGADLYLSGAAQAVYKINPATLQTEWAAATFGAPTTPPVAADEGLGLIFVGTNQNTVHAFSAIDGTEVWRGQTSNSVVGLATDGVSVVYATAADGTVYCWNGATGETLWPAVNTGSGVTAPLADANYVLVGTQAGDVLYINAVNGAEEASLRLSLGDPILYPLTPAGGWLFVRGTSIYGLGP